MKLGPLFPIALAILCFGVSVTFSFSGDDYVQIVQNPLITTHSFLEILKTPTFPGDLYRPIPSLTFALEDLIFGANPVGFHLTNLILYLVVIFLISRLYGNGTAAIFAVMPIHIEAVVPVYAARCELSAALFVLLSIVATRKQHQFLAALLIAVGIFSKESAALAPLLIAIDLLRRKERLANAALPLGAALLALYIRMRLVPPLPTELIDNPLINLETVTRIQVALTLLGNYAINCLIPIGIGFDYSVGNTPLSILSIHSLGMFICALSLVAIGLRKFAGVGFGLNWFFISFLMTANFIPIGTAYGDRLAFLPSLGIAVLLTDLFVASGAYKLVMPAFVAVSALVTTRILPSFQDDYTLTARRVRLSPNARVLANYAIMNRNNGAYDAAIAAAQSSLKFYPSYDFAYYALGSTEMLRGETAAALDAYNKALELAPNQEQSLAALGRYYLNIGPELEAKLYFDRLLKVNPLSFEARLGLAVLEARVAPNAAISKLRSLAKERPGSEAEVVLRKLSTSVN